MQVALLEQFPAQGYRGTVGVAEEGVFDDDTRLAAGAQVFDEVFQKEVGRLARLDGEVLLYLASLFAAERRVGQDIVEAVFLLHVGQILGEGVGLDDVG